MGPNGRHNTHNVEVVPPASSRGTMRWNGFLLASVFVFVTLSGCSDKDDGDDADKLNSLECPEDDLGSLDVPAGDADDSDNGTAVDDLNGTLALLRGRQQAENGTDEAGEEVLQTTSADACPEDVADVSTVPPVADLVMTADDGTVQNGTTFILTDQNVTFSAAGSSDDGTIQLAALTVTDSNSTRTVQLYDGGFQDVTLPFAHEGPVNVTLRVLDDAGEVDLVESMLYVNRLHSLTIAVDAALPAGHSADACDFPDDTASVVWQPFMDRTKFIVNSGAMWISAEMTSGSGEYALCDPGHAPLTEASSSAVETARDGSPLTPSPQYAVFGVSTGGVDDLTFDVMVHYEP